MDMFLRLLLILLLVFWFVPQLRRFISRRRRPVSEEGVDRGRRDHDERLASLTRQDISDADFEELPPEK
jgi:hypothetical protein